ncbi:MAG: rhodanese-like domain-containing protein [Candidatus Limnocylindrales bacterium]
MPSSHGTPRVTTRSPRQTRSPQARTAPSRAVAAAPVPTRSASGRTPSPPARRTVGDLLENARARLTRLEPGQAQRAVVDDGALLIDTRCAELRRESGVVPGSVHVPLSVLYWRLDPSSGHADMDLATPQRQVVLFCAHGYSSSIAAATLQDLGFSRATDVIGGFEAWAAAGLPVEPAP